MRTNCSPTVADNAPNFENVGGAYCIWLVRPSRFLMHDITVNARALKFHVCIPHRKIADLYFSCPSYLPFWTYAPLKKSEGNLVSKISRKVFEVGA